MIKIKFYKLQASGNDFILVDNLKTKSKLTKKFYQNLAKEYCDRKFGIGADGLLAIEPSRKAHFKMRIFNSDGSEAEMCGNGARCVGLWRKFTKKKTENISFETIAGIIEVNAKIKGYAANVKVKLSDPFSLKLNLPLKIFGKDIKVNFINTGVPHVVVFVQGLDTINVDKIGRKIRFHKKFSPQGTNVNFIEVKNNNFVEIRTYERGVEAETLACGTGAVASAIIASNKLKTNIGSQKITVKTKNGELLKVSFEGKANMIKDVWLEGRAQLVFSGEIYLY